jgi:hypothetical protein
VVVNGCGPDLIRLVRASVLFEREADWIIISSVLSSSRSPEWSVAVVGNAESWEIDDAEIDLEWPPSGLLRPFVSTSISAKKKESNL